MPEVSGINCIVKVAGAPVAMIGEPTGANGANLIWTITDAAKRVLDRTLPIYVQKKGTNDAAEALTTTTTLKMTAHGLVTNDLIINTTRANAKRLVTYVDANTVTVAAVTGQVSGDVIEVYKTESAAAGIMVNTLNGTITYATASGRTLVVSASYLPLSAAAYAHKASHSREAGTLDNTPFGATHKTRIAGLKSASGTLSQFNIVDTTFEDALTAGNPLVIEQTEITGTEPTRFWAQLESSEVAAAIEDLQDNTISWVSHDAWIRLGV